MNIYSLFIAFQFSIKKLSTLNFPLNKLFVFNFQFSIKKLST